MENKSGFLTKKNSLGIYVIVLGSVPWGAGGRHFSFHFHPSYPSLASSLAIGQIAMTTQNFSGAILGYHSNQLITDQ